MVDLRINGTLQTGAVRKPHLPGSKSVYLFLEFTIVIIDELKARRYAQQIGLQVTGTIDVLLLAKEQGLINAIQPPIMELQVHGLYLSSTLIDKALQLAGETQ